METDSDSEKKSRNDKSHSGNVLQPVRVRRGLRLGDKVDRIISRHGYYLLCHLSLLFWIVLPLEKEKRENG